MSNEKIKNRVHLKVYSGESERKEEEKRRTRRNERALARTWERESDKHGRKEKREQRERVKRVKKKFTHTIY